MGSIILHLVALGFKKTFEVFFEDESRVVGSQGDLHQNLPARVRAAPPPGRGVAPRAKPPS